MTAKEVNALYNAAQADVNRKIANAIVSLKVDIKMAVRDNADLSVDDILKIIDTHIGKYDKE